jgi:hypothetical protein
VTEVDYCRWCAGEASDSRACTCPHDCGITGCMRSPAMPEPASIDDGWDDEPCSHDCDEECEDEWGYSACRHQHCFNCGGCGCPGYCDDHQTYNLRPAETGGGAGPGEDDRD